MEPAYKHSRVLMPPTKVPMKVLRNRRLDQLYLMLRFYCFQFQISRIFKELKYASAAVTLSQSRSILNIQKYQANQTEQNPETRNS
jgi:hypothetical protein